MAMVVWLDRDEAEVGDLPPVCIRCGRDAAEYKARTFHWYPWYAGGLMRMLATQRITVELPMCEYHAGEWALFNGPRKLWGLRVTEITPHSLTLAGVHEDFAEALEDYREGRGPKEWYRGRRPQPRRRPARERDEERPSRRGARDRPARRRGDDWPRPRPASYTWVWVLLGVGLAPFLLCAVLGVLAALLPHRPMPNPYFPPMGPPFDGAPQAPAAADMQREIGREAVGFVFGWAPEGPFPGNASWPAMGMLFGKELGAPPGQVAAGNLDAALADLHGNVFTARDAARRLAEMRPDEERRAEVARALEANLLRPEVPVREAAAGALAVWGTPDNVPALSKLLDDLFPNVREQALAALAAIKDPDSAEPIAKKLTDFAS